MSKWPSFCLVALAPPEAWQPEQYLRKIGIAFAMAACSAAAGSLVAAGAETVAGWLAPDGITSFGPQPQNTIEISAQRTYGTMLVSSSRGMGSKTGGSDESAQQSSSACMATSVGGDSDRGA